MVESVQNVREPRLFRRSVADSLSRVARSLQYFTNRSARAAKSILMPGAFIAESHLLSGYTPRFMAFTIKVDDIANHPQNAISGSQMPNKPFHAKGPV
jgi:hypothetical protein